MPWGGTVFGSGIDPASHRDVPAYGVFPRRISASLPWAPARQCRWKNRPKPSIL